MVETPDNADSIAATVPVELDEEVVPEFVQESGEQLAETDGYLISLETDPSDEESLGGVFRCFHTIKGLAGFLGFEQIEHLAHAAEDLLDQAHKIPLDSIAIDIILTPRTCCVCSSKRLVKQSHPACGLQAIKRGPWSWPRASGIV